MPTLKTLPTFNLHSADEHQKKEQTDQMIGLFSGYLF
jgi:hypothetical protein